MSIIDVIASREEAHAAALAATTAAATTIYWNAVTAPAAGKPPARQADELAAALTALGRTTRDLRADAASLAELGRIATDCDLPTAQAAAREARGLAVAAFAEAAQLRKQAEAVETAARYAQAQADSNVYVAQQAARDAERIRDELRLRGCPPCPQVPAPPEPVAQVLVEVVDLPPVETAFQRPFLLVGNRRCRLGDRFEVDAETLASRGAFLRLASLVDAERAAERERADAEQRAAIAALQAAEEVADEPNATTENDGYSVGDLEDTPAETLIDADGQPEAEQPVVEAAEQQESA